MIYIPAPIVPQRRLVWYLAMEEFIARNFSRLAEGSGAKEAFFVWQVAPTVIFGRNQDMHAEVNEEYCKSNGISMFRRKSGGGCVYADQGNIMISVVSCEQGPSAFLFSRYLQMLELSLRKLGLEASRSGRNDVLVGGRKVSGNAMFRKPGACIMHGTMLFDSDLEAMQNAITPSESKLRRKGVQSVRQRVTNLKDELKKEMSLEEMKAYLVDFFKGADDAEIKLTEADFIEIENLESYYLNPEFIDR